VTEYKVLTEGDAPFRGNFSPERLENVLNEYAADGWRLASSFQTQNIWKTIKTNIVLILERSKS
jgi:phosphoenolpyruvate carboxylase